MTTIQRTLLPQSLRRLTYRVGSLIVIVGTITHYVFRYFNLVSRNTNKYVMYCSICAGLSLIFVSNINKSKDFNNLLSGYGAILFMFATIIYFGDFFIDDWFHTKSIYIMVGGIILCFLQMLYRHWKS